MEELIGAWDGAAETAIRHRHFSEPAQTMHEYVGSKQDECWQALGRNAGHTFTDREMMLDPATHGRFQELIDLAYDRREFGAVGASDAALGRAVMAWLDAEVARWAEPTGGAA